MPPTKRSDAATRRPPTTATVESGPASTAQPALAPRHGRSGRLWRDLCVPHARPAHALITGVACGVRVEEVADPLMRKIRMLDKLIDELARGKAMDKFLRR